MLLSVFNTFDEIKHSYLIGITRENKKRYSLVNGYQYIEFPNLNEQIHKWSSWIKIFAILKCFDENPSLEWIFWCDVDNLIMDFEYKLENLVDTDKHFVCSLYKNLWKLDFDDFSGNDFNVLTSAFFVRNSDIAKNILHALYYDSRFKTTNFELFQTAEELAFGLYLNKYPDLKKYFKFVSLSFFTSVDPVQVGFVENLGFDLYTDHFILSTYNYNFGSFLDENDKLKILSKHLKNSNRSSLR